MLLLALTVLVAVHQGYCQDTGAVRLVNGRSDYEGRVEVFANGEWGTVCDDNFGMENAHVICRMLGYNGALAAYSAGYFGRGTGEIWVDQLNCAGDEEKILDCSRNNLGEHDCSHGEDVGIECDSTLLIPEPSSAMLPVRLTCPYNKTCNNIARKRGPDPDECKQSVHVEGIVEVYYNETWWFISADDWDDADVNVVCGQLGFPLAFGTVSHLNNLLPKGTKVQKLVRKRFNRELRRRVLMKNVQCNGTENKLGYCTHHGFGPFHNLGGKVATVRCGFHHHPSCGKKCQKQPIYRLRGGAQPWMGRVEVLHNNKWGTVCGREFNDASANVLCRSLGYGTARTITRRAGYGRGIGKIWISQSSCSGTESWLHKCEGFSWGDSPQCNDHSTDVGVECNVPDVYYGQKELIRIVSSGVEPFVEVADHDNKSGYGLLCYDDVDVPVAQVICRSLPESQFLDTYKQSNHSTYTGQRYKGRFICNGNETDIHECHMSLYPVPTCDSGDLLIYCDTRRPDLVPDLTRFSHSLEYNLAVQMHSMSSLQCALEENCLASDAVNQSSDSYRKLLRFDSLTMNYGLRDFTPVRNRHEWIWHSCHDHYHSFEVFIEYDLLSLNGTKVAEGHKASFCLEDSLCDAGVPYQYTCGYGDQGISVNCGDLYTRVLDCQWIDITGIPDGSYIIQLNVNPSQLVIESDHRNNIIQCIIVLQEEQLSVMKCLQSDHEPMLSC